MHWYIDTANPIQPTTKPAVNKLKQKYLRIVGMVLNIFFSAERKQLQLDKRFISYIYYR